MKTIFLFIVLLFASCSANKPYENDKKFVIGFSQCTMVDKWRETIVIEMEREISFYRDYKIDFIVADAHDDTRQQIEDIRELVNSGIDLLIVSPNEALKLTETVEEVYNKGIPVIVIDRKINSSSFSAYIGADNFSVGQEAGYFAAELLKGKGRVLEITGLQSSTPAIERSAGFRDIIKKYPEIRIVKNLEGRWLENYTLKITDSLFYSFAEFDLIFAQNDFMARAASYSSKKHKIKPYIIGVDGLNCPEGGISMVLNGTIDGTILYPTGGDKAIELAMNILTTRLYPKNTTLNTFRIDNTNARNIWLQGEEIRSQQTKIDNLSKLLNDMSSVLKKRQVLLSITITFILGLILVVIVVFMLLRQKNLLNKALDIKNKTISQQFKIISSQRDDSINLLMLAEEVKETKLRMFTDISHEFRTAVSLILSPLEDLIKNTGNKEIRANLELINKNASRLNKLSDSILRFRNLDENKYAPSYTGSNISDHLNEIIEKFEEKAKNKKINISREIPEYLFAEFDPAGIEKIIYNLMSNAIKYNKLNGTIKVSLCKDNLNILIKIKDTGIGIPEKDLPYIFNRFYKAGNSRLTNENEGVGVGLAISKEMVQLLGGTLSVTSFENEGSTFFVSLPQFSTQSAFKLVSETNERNLSDLKVDVDPDKMILVVEDNPDLLQVISKLTGKYYNVITASNGMEGLHLAKKKLPALIISDILMPGMDGLQMCKAIKNDPTTCQIPVILLTALDSQEYAIKGYEIGADAYITKPFNETLILTYVRNLIETRRKITDAYCPSAFFREIFQTKDSNDQNFIKRCLEIIYENAESEAFGLTELASKMALSRSSLYRKIKEICEVRPVDFMKKARLNYSAKLLLSKNLTVNEIAWRSGFSDSKYFSKCFYQEFGCYPRKYMDLKNVTPTDKDIN